MSVDAVLESPCHVAAGARVVTHYHRGEVEELADSIAVIDHGQVIAEGTSDQLKSRVGGEKLEVTLEDPDQRRVAIDTLIPISGDEPPTCDGPIVRMPMRRELGGIAEAVRRLDGAGVGIADIAVRRPTLDDVFMVLTGHAAEHENGEDEEQEPEPEREEAAA